MATATAVSTRKNSDTLTASTDQFTLKNRVDAQGAERDFVEGFLATTHLDKGNDKFTEEALKSMAEDISGENVDAVFNDVDQEELREARVGNLDHNNNPAAPFGDTRTVPAFKTVDAQVRQTDDGKKGLWIRAVLNSDGMLPETVSAVKNSIKDNFLNAFSIEFIAEKVRQIKENDKVVRIIEEAKAKGAALTGRPMNPEAEMTASDLKSRAVNFENDVTPMTKDDEQDPSEEEPEPEPEEDVKSEAGEEDGEPEEGEDEDGEGQEATASESIEEIKSTVQEVKSVNEELREENEELKGELKDLRQLQEIKSEVDEVKSLLEDVDLEDGPRAEQEQKRMDDGEESKAEWKQAVDRVGADYLEGEGSSKSNIEAFAENHGIKSEEVKNYVSN